MNAMEMAEAFRIARLESGEEWDDIAQDQHSLIAEGFVGYADGYVWITEKGRQLAESMPEHADGEE
jgi:hypothetical protein